MGNHDDAVNTIAHMKWFNPEARTVLALTRRMLSDESLEYLKTLPDSMEKENALLVHGCPPASFRTYIYMVPARGLIRIMEGLPHGMAFVGHTHEMHLYFLEAGGNLRQRPMTRETLPLSPALRYIINTGSVGQPRDGNPRAKYSIWDTGRLLLENRFVPYDTEKTARKILDAGFPEHYAWRLFGRRM